MCLMHLLLSVALTGTADYPRKELLIEPADLARMPGQFLVLDVRAKPRYLQGHIPNSVWIDAELWSQSFARHQDPGKWAMLLGGAGIDPGKRIVIYDAALAKDAARIWWILRYWGCEDVRLLNGGWPGWLDRELPVDKEPATPAKLKIELGKARSRLFATKQSVLDALKEKKTQLIDARSAAEHCGAAKLARRGGGIPGAIHLEWSDLVDKKTQRFKGPDELLRIFKTAGIDLAAPAIAHCQSGGRSSVMAFAMELMGAGNVANYYRGWSEWGNAEDTPVVVPKK
ncbi:MAG: sulfurtransferase [Planctomycetes bacterium]|nr:sulfurtransferase [Planctomycetota bacterium]